MAGHDGQPRRRTHVTQGQQQIRELARRRAVAGTAGDRRRDRPRHARGPPADRAGVAARARAERRGPAPDPARPGSATAVAAGSDPRGAIRGRERDRAGRHARRRRDQGGPARQDVPPPPGARPDVPAGAAQRRGGHGAGRWRRGAGTVLRSLSSAEGAGAADPGRDPRLRRSPRLDLGPRARRQRAADRRLHGPGRHRRRATKP